MNYYYTYILQSESHGTHYYGSSGDPQRRLKDHNRGKVRYTKGRRPWKLIYQERFASRSQAMQRELFFKSVDGHAYLKQKGIL